MCGRDCGISRSMVSMGGSGIGSGMMMTRTRRASDSGTVTMVGRGGWSSHRGSGIMMTVSRRCGRGSGLDSEQRTPKVNSGGRCRCGLVMTCGR